MHRYIYPSPECCCEMLCIRVDFNAERRILVKVMPMLSMQNGEMGVFMLQADRNPFHYSQEQEILSMGVMMIMLVLVALDWCRWLAEM